MPHNLVGSYRGMKIAEQMPSFDYGTLASCWYAGHSEGDIEKDKYVLEVEAAIGAKKRKEILEAPLPNLDDAIKKLEEHDIDFDAYELLVEIKAGRLEPSEIVNRAIDDYSDKHLIFRGLSEEFRTAYQALSAKGIIATFNRVLSNYSGVSHAYVESAQPVITQVIPLITAGYLEIKTTFEGLEENIDRMNDQESWDFPSVQETFKTYTESITKRLGAIGQTLEELQQAGEQVDRIDSKKFINYHRCFNSLGRALNDIQVDFSTLASSDKHKGEGLARNEKQYLVMSDQATSLLGSLNRALREHMPDAYQLI